MSELTGAEVQKARDLIEQAWSIVYSEWAVNDAQFNADKGHCFRVFDELARRCGFSEPATT